MDIATLLHTMTSEGLTLRLGEADALHVVGAVHKLTLAQQQALREHKLTLVAMLTPPPTCFIPGDFDAAREREAIQWADTPEAMEALGDAIEYFEKLADDMRWQNPQALSIVALEQEPSPTPCQRCQGQQTYLAIIHNGESLRRDCARCGRFVAFASWCNRQQTGEILARTLDQTWYNENRTAQVLEHLSSSDEIPLTNKESRCG